MQQQPTSKSAESSRMPEPVFRFCSFLTQLSFDGHRPMAWCPSCRKELPATAVSCESCGYDFPHRPAPQAQHWAWSPVADMVLVAGQFLSLLATIAPLLSALRCLLFLEFFEAGSHLLQAAILCGMFVVFARVQQIQK